MRRNPLLYSDHSEVEEPITYEEAPKQKRSVLFYFIILANSLLVMFVLGIIWFLFLKSPDLHIKELTEKFFGTSQTVAETNEKPASESNLENKDNTNAVAPTPSRQKQEEIQQIRLKQMREQENLATERQRLEQIRAEIEAAKAKKALVETSTVNKTEIPEPDSAQTAPSVGLTPSSTEANTLSDSTETEKTTSSEVTPQPEDAVEPAIVPNAASETLTPPGNSVGTQIDQIMEQMKQQQKEKTINQPLNDSKAPKSPENKRKLAMDSVPVINHRVIEKQLEALIEAETLKSEAGKLLDLVNDPDKKIHINQKLSILQANAV